MKSKKQGFLYGTVILASGTILVKLIGAFFKIPLTNLLGGVGMSYFNVAYDLYYPLYALFISGVPVAVSKLVSESMALGRARDARKLIRIAAVLFVGIGSVGSLIMFFGAGAFTALVRNPDAKFAVQALSPALFFGCVMAAFRGYWQGLQDMRPTAVSQVVEACAKLFFGLTAACGIGSYLANEYARSGRMLGTEYPNADAARMSMLPYMAAGAIFGVTLSTLCGALYLYWRHKRCKGGITAAQRMQSPPSRGGRALAKRLILLAIPVCLASVVSNMTSFIDLISLMNRLEFALDRAPAILMGQYAGLLPRGVGAEKLASYLYGCYSGLAVPLYNLVPSLTATIGVSLLPAVSAAWSTRHTAALTRNVGSALRLAALLSFPAGFGLSVLAQPILQLVYYSKPMEAAVIAPALRLMGIGAMFVALSLPVNAVLQAIGRADLPVKLLLLGGLVKLGCNYFLVAIPGLNIQAAPVGTICCYGITLFGGLYALASTPGLSLPWAGTFGKPFFAGICCAAGAWAANGFMSKWADARLAVAFAIAFGGVCYLIAVLLTRTIQRDDLFMVPHGEKFAKILENHNLLG